MPETVPELVSRGGDSQRRRLVVAIGGTLVLGVIAATIAREEQDQRDAASTSSSPAFDLGSLVQEIGPPPGPAPTARAVPDPRAEATEALRVRVDRYLDARAAAVRQLDTARRQGVDPAVISAMAVALGVPADAATPTEPSDGAAEAASVVGGGESRAL